MKKLLIIFLLICLLTSSIWSQWPYQQKPMMGMQVNGAHRLGDFIGAWLFLEGSGGQVFDLSGNGNVGTIDTGIIWVPGKFGSSLDYDGSANAQIIVPNSSSFLGMSQLTISIWAKYEGSERVDEYSLIDTWSSGDRNYLLRYDDGAAVNAIEFFTYTSGQVGGAFTGTDMSDGKWHHIVAVYDGANMYVYFDGIRSATSFAQTGIIGEVSPSTSTLEIGSPIESIVDFWNGKIDVPMIYNRALSASEIALLYREPFCMFAEDNIPLMAQEAPAAPGGQVISIQMTAIPLLVFFLILIKLKHEK